MIMRTITASTITATLFDADPYLFERNVVKFKTTRSLMYLRSGSSSIATYNNVANKEIFIDLTEYVIANPNPTSAITLYDNSTTATITWQSSGKLFNPNKVQRPNYPLYQFFTKNNVRVNFPNVIFAPSSVFSGDHFLTWSPSENLDFNLVSSGGDNIIDNNSQWGLFADPNPDRNDMINGVRVNPGMPKLSAYAYQEVAGGSGSLELLLMELGQ